MKDMGTREQSVHVPVLDSHVLSNAIKTIAELAVSTRCTRTRIGAVFWWRDEREGLAELQRGLQRPNLLYFSRFIGFLYDIQIESYTAYKPTFYLHTRTFLRNS